MILCFKTDIFYVKKLTPCKRTVMEIYPITMQSTSSFILLIHMKHSLVSNNFCKNNYNLVTHILLVLIVLDTNVIASRNKNTLGLPTFNQTEYDS